MALKRGYMYLALRGLETVLREMADESGIVEMSNRKIAAKLQVGLRQLNEMIGELVQERRVHKGRGLVRLNGSVKESNGSVKESNGSVKDARHEDSKTLKTSRTHGSHESHEGFEFKEKKDDEDDPRHRRLDFLNKNPVLRGLFKSYRHNPSTDHVKDLDDAIAIWPQAVAVVGIDAIVEHFDACDQMSINPERQLRFSRRVQTLIDASVI